MAKMPVSDIDKKVGKRIQQCRKENNFTAAMLSERIDISIQQLSRYERGVNKITLDHLEKIAEELKTPISWFFIDSDQSYEVKAINKVTEKKEPYNHLNQNDLEKRLIQRFSHLSTEQKRLLVLFLDTLK